MKTLSKLVTFVLLLSLFTSCSSEETSIKTNTIVDVAVNSNLSSLVAAVTKAELVNTLNGPGPFTVLAPTNEAFAEFLSENNFNSVDDVPKELLTQILLNHVIDGSLKSTDLSTGYANTKATSNASNTLMSIYINTDGGVKFNGISTVTTANIDADNGIVHVIDKVIALPTVVTFATADSNFSVLVEALTRSDLDTDFVSILSLPASSNTAPYTVFAPINSAFINVLEELNLTALSDIQKNTLDLTLKTHVLSGTNALDTDLSTGLNLITLSSEILTVDLTASASLTDEGNRVSNIIATNVQANNGVIHAIDKVLLPN
ncbi:fasciclin domain-containing protein [Polaribacter butkevichii]|uniref:Fasciclin n=1 Tax=Polaribacter butkevichii TaxID=218490 RepID=A0A2P6CAM4_9FLAO|nr:fasciclin domain-containing protein [Polaribacter butkevichii]PQJ71974.1 fasciclin [Polaribacter butkevichii]